ncbi:hypothetical protein LTS03_012011, partial [Exophiala xenobiotica]
MKATPTPAKSRGTICKKTDRRKKDLWTSDEDRLLKALRQKGCTWRKISTRLSGRSATSCRLRHQNYLEQLSKEEKHKLKQLYM